MIDDFWVWQFVIKLMRVWQFVIDVGCGGCDQWSGCDGL